MPGLILEGGTFRPIFSCGVMDALLNNGLMFDYVIGVSAGITDAASYISRQPERNLRILKEFRNDPRYLSIGNYRKCHSLFGLDFVFGEVPNEIDLFDWDAFRAYKGKMLVGVTNAQTGRIEYLDGKDMDSNYTMLRATCAIPIYFPPIKVNGIEYYDGGLADSIPIRKSLRDGNRKNLIVLTQPQGFHKGNSSNVRVANRLLHRNYPNLCRTMMTRSRRYNDTLCFCEQLEKKRPKDTVIIRPAYSLNSFESDVDQLEINYRHGYDLAMQRMDDIRALFDE